MMKLKQKKSAKFTLSDRIADALTLKPRADIEDDAVFGTKPKTVSRDDFGSSNSEDEAAISEFRKRNVNLLSDVSLKYQGQVVSRKDLDQFDSEVSEESTNGNQDIQQNLLSKLKQKIAEVSSDSDLPAKPKLDSDSDDSESDGSEESNDYTITKFQKTGQSNGEESSGDEKGSDDDEGEGYDISQMEEPLKESFEHVKKLNISEEAKKGICVRNQLLVWEGLLEMRIHMQRCVNTANQMPIAETFDSLKDDIELAEESNVAKAKLVNVLDK